MPAPGSRQFTVTRHRPLRHGAMLLVAVLALSSGGWLLFERGRDQAGYDRENWRVLEADLRQQIGELETRNADLLRQNSLLQRSADIDRNAYVEIQRALADTQSETLALNEQLSFYRGLVTPSGKAEGLQVERINLQPTAQDNAYDFSLTLVQVKRNDRFAHGEVDLSVSGKQGDRQSSYRLGDLADVEGAFKFKFKYFQNFEGTLLLPDGFRPESVLIDVKPKGKRLKPVNKRFAWTSILNGGS